jgi:tetratricopeptide (TPR) repeat protein
MALLSSFAALFAAAALVASPAAEGPARLMEQFQAAAEAMSGGKDNLAGCKRAGDQLDRIAADPGFGGLPPSHQRMTLLMVLACAPPDSAKAVAAATALAPIAKMPVEVQAANGVLLDDAGRREDAKAFISAFSRMVALDPAAFAAADPRGFQWAIFQVQDDPALTETLLSDLRAIPWTDPIGRDAVDHNWALGLARISAEAGDETKAIALLDRATAPGVLMTVAQDRRFARIWPELEAAGRFDWIKVQTSDLQHWRDLAEREPGRLLNISSQIDALRALGRYDEALALGQAYARRLKAGEAFDDADEQRPWLLNAHAYTLYDLGRYDEADAVMTEAEGIGQNGDGVSQRINRAELLIDAGQVARALKVLDTVKDKQSSTYGLMWRDAGLACAKAQQGDLAGARATAQAMAARWKDNAAAATKALVCADQADEAAALYIRRLDDPTTRAEALEAFRAGRAPPKTPPFQAAFQARLVAIQARPEVQAAVARWGRALTVPLAGTYWGSL